MTLQRRHGRQEIGMTLDLYVDRGRYMAVIYGTPQEDVKVGVGSSPQEAVASLEATEHQPAELSGRSPDVSSLDDDPGANWVLAQQSDHALAVTARLAQAINELREAIKDGDEAAAVALAKELVQGGRPCQIKGEDGDSDDPGDNGVLYVVGERALLVDGQTVAEWTRCTGAGYGGEHGEARPDSWESWEDTTGGDRLPDVVAAVLEVLDLEDGIPDGADEPDEPEADSDGEYGFVPCCGHLGNGDDPVPDRAHRYVNEQERDAGMAAWRRGFLAANPGNRPLAPWPVPVSKDDARDWRFDETEEVED